MSPWNARVQELFFFAGLFALVFTALAGNGEQQEVVVKPARILHIAEPSVEPLPALVPIS